MAVSYWGPPTSSVDFCEANYGFSAFVAEPANALSSFIIVAQGVVGVYLMRLINDKNIALRRAFIALYAILAIVGLGSVALHTTLQAFSQALDEFPMLLLSITLIFTLSELDSTSTLKRPRGPLFCALVGSIVCIVYITFQGLYFVFLATYISSVVVIVVWNGSLALRRRVDKRAEEIRLKFTKPLYIAAMLSYVGFGSIAWVTDFVMCTYFSRFGILGAMVLHPLWHFGAGTGTWLAIQVLAASRAENLGTEPRLVWVLGALPFVVYTSP